MASRDRKPSMIRWIHTRVDRFLHHPLTEMAVVVLIVIWVGALIGEYILPDPVSQSMLDQLGVCINILFVIELLLRFWIAPVKRRFFRDYYLDIIAVVPIAPVRPLRLLRLLRVGALMHRSAGDIAVIGMLSLCFILGTAMLLDNSPGNVIPTEQGELGNIWFSTMTFIGGEPIGGLPATEEGQLITLALMVGGMTFFGMFIGAISATMTTAFTLRFEASNMERIDQMTNHLIICGWNLAGPTMLQELFSSRQTPRQVVIITEQETPPDNMDIPQVRNNQMLHMQGDFTQVNVLEQANVSKCAMAIILTDTLTPRSDQDRDARTVLTALTIERLNPDVFCCAELTSWEHAELLQRSGVEEIVVRDWYAGAILGSMSRTRGLATVLRDILSTQNGNSFHKQRIHPKDLGKTVGELHSELKQERGIILVALEHEEANGTKTMTVNPPADQRVTQKDTLVIIGPPKRT